MQRRLVRSTIRNRQANQNVILRSLGVFGEHIEVTMLIKNTRIDQFELWRTQAAPAILLDQPGVRIFGLRILVQRLHVRMRRRRVEIVVELLYVLAVVAFRSRQTEESLFQNAI